MRRGRLFGNYIKVLSSLGFIKGTRLKDLVKRTGITNTGCNPLLRNLIELGYVDCELEKVSVSWKDPSAIKHYKLTSRGEVLLEQMQKLKKTIEAVNKEKEQLKKDLNGVLYNVR